MDKMEMIQQAIQDILNTCPHYENKVYLLGDYKYKKSIHVMYDSFKDELKSTYIDKHGVYINGRSQRQKDKNKLYLKDFDEFEFIQSELDKVEQKVKEIKDSLDTRIPSKDIKVGDICREYNALQYNYIYLGRYEIEINYTKCRNSWRRDKDIIKYKANFYIDLDKENSCELSNIKEPYYTKINDRKLSYEIKECKTKKRFDKIVGKVNDIQISTLIKWIEENQLENQYGATVNIKLLD